MSNIKVVDVFSKNVKYFDCEEAFYKIVDDQNITVKDVLTNESIIDTLLDYYIPTLIKSK